MQPGRLRTMQPGRLRSMLPGRLRSMPLLIGEMGVPLICGEFHQFDQAQQLLVHLVGGKSASIAVTSQNPFELVLSQPRH